jgi:glycosyltransferase involved in cell wall biosynthesis
MYAAWRRRVPWVLEVRDLWPEIPIAMGVLAAPVLQKLAFLLADRAYSSSKHIVALSPGMAQGIVARGVSPAKITTIPNGCDLELFDASGIDRQVFRAEHPELGKRPIALYAGTIGKVNGLEYMVDMAVAALARGSDVVFVVVGSGGRAKIIADRARQSGVLGRNFFMYPSLPKRRIANVMRAADVTLSLVTDVTALNDNSANKFFDSLAAARPIAINHEGWLADMIRSHELGVVLPARSPSTAADLIERFLQDAEKARGAGVAARNLAVMRFSRERLLDTLEKLLLQTVNTSP